MPLLAAWLLVRGGLLRGALEEWRVVQAQLGGPEALVEPGLTGLLVIASARRELWLATAAGLTLLALLPCLYRRLRASGFSAYARHLRRAQRSQIEHDWQVHRRAVARLLEPFGRRVAEEPADEWFGDPPWRREPIPPNPAAFDRIRTVREIRLPPGYLAD